MALKSLKPQTRLSHPQASRLIDAYASGLPIQQIAERFRVHRTTITRIVSRSEVTMRNRHSPAPMS
ncbi:MAG: helix-turn-helix domain-containing protein [Nigerium sp.]|nr:helix-turn-helix domain-containing protein [Nigerium sp.]